MKEAIRRFPSQFVVTAVDSDKNEERTGTEATETALSIILQGLASPKAEEGTRGIRATSEA